MSEQKLNRLFAAARNETVPVPPEHFAGDVLRAVRREQPASAPATLSIFDELNLLFPRLAWLAAMVIALGIVADFGLTAAGLPNLNAGVAQISSQWFFTGTGF